MDKLIAFLLANCFGSLASIIAWQVDGLFAVPATATTPAKPGLDPKLVLPLLTPVGQYLAGTAAQPTGSQLQADAIAGIADIATRSAAFYGITALTPAQMGALLVAVYGKLAPLHP